MGSNHSQRNTMESSSNGDPSGSAESEDRLEGGSDLTTILQYLIRSGQVQMISGDYEEPEYSDDSADVDYLEVAEPPESISEPDTHKLQNSEFAEDLKRQTNYCISKCNSGTKKSVSKLLSLREIGVNQNQCFTKSDCCAVSSNYLPNECELVSSYNNKAFCGTFSKDGNIFLSAAQDRCVRIYDTTNGQWREFKKIRARDVGWSVLDTAFSPDGNYVIYSSWSDYIHICNLYGEHETHSALHLFPDTNSNFCIFSLMFSCDNSEILGAANDGHLYVFDRERNERTLKIDAHEDDANAVCFADSSSNILFSGGDDGLLKVWDRRTLKEAEATPVGVLAGHSDGITFIDTKGDGRYFMSNCKDQSIKLWDIRKFSSQDAIEATRREVARQHWDYRWQQVPSSVRKKYKVIPGDTSLMTYSGHSVLHTLVRARFSPMFSTGQRYIYSGCATGAIVIYDVLTGKAVSTLKEHTACVRDVSWHPYDNTIMSTSWDGTIGRWTYSSKIEYDSDEQHEDNASDSDESEDEKHQKRRSLRLLQKKRKQKSCVERRSRGLLLFD